MARDTEDDGCTVDSAVNDAGEEIPLRGLLRVTGVDADGFIKVAKPAADGVFHCVNWKEPMPVGARGQVTFDARCVMLYDTAGGTPDPSAEWGAAAGSFYLTAGKKGVLPFGGIRSLTSPAGTGLVLAGRLGGSGCAGTIKELVSICFSETNNTNVAVTANTTITNLHRNVEADASGGAVTLTMDDPANFTSEEVTLRKVDSSANAVTVSPFGSETFTGYAGGSWHAAASSLTLASQGAFVILYQRAGNWRIKAAS